MTLALDGHNSSFTAGATNATISITTTLPNTVILLAAFLYSNTTTIHTVSSVTDNSGQGTSWAKRSGISGLYDTNNGADAELWWVNLPTAATITITMAGSGASDTISLFADGVNGANTTSPFDADASLPGVAHNLSTTGANITQTISTTSANTFVYTAFTEHANVAASLPATPPSGFTGLDVVSGSNVSTFNDGQSDYQIFSSAQPGLVLTYLPATTAQPRWSYLVDAVVQAGGAAARTPTLTLMGVG